MNFRSYIAHACAALLLLTTSAQAESSGPGNVPPSYGSPFSNPGHAGPSSQSEGGKDLATILREPLPSRNTERVKALKDRIAQLESAKAGLDREFQMNPNMGEQDLTRLVGDYQGFIYPSAGNETASLGDVINPGINLQTRIGNLKKYAGGTMRDLILQYRIELITLEKQRDMRERNVNCGGEVQDDPDGKKLLFVERRDGKTDYIKGRDDALFALFGTRESAKALRKKYLNDMSRFLGDVIKNCDASSKMVESIKAIFPIHARLFRDVREEDFNRNLAALIDSAMLILDFEDKELRKGWGDQLILRGEETLDRFAEDAPVELAPTLKKRLADIAKNPRLSVQKDARTTVALLSGSDKARQFRQFLNLGEKDVGSLSALTEAVGSNDPFRSNNPVTTGQHFTKPSDIAARLHYGHSPKALEALDYQPSGNREDARKQLLRMLEATKKPDFAGFFPTGNKPKGLQPLPDETRAAYRRVVEKALARVDGFKPEQPHATPYIVQLTEEQNLITAAKEACENDVEENLSSIADFVAKSTQQPLPPSARVQLLKFPRSYRVLLAALSKQMVRDLRTVEIDIKDRQPALRAAMKIEERQKFLNELIFSPSLPKLGALIHSLDWKAVFDLSSTSEAYADFNPYREKHESLTPGNKDQLREKIITRILAAMARGKEYVDSENPKKTDFACADSDVVDLGTLLMSVIDNWEGTKGFIPDYLDKWKGATIGNYSHDFVDFMQELNLYNLGKYKPNDPELTAERERARRRGLSMNSGDRVRFLTRHELTEDDKKALAALKSGPLGDRFKREDPTGYANLHAHPTRYGIQEASNLYGKYSPYNVPDYVSTYRKNQFRQSNHRFVESALKVLDNPVKFDDLIDRFGDYYLKRTGQQLHHALQASRDTLKKMHEALLAEEKAGVASEKRKRIVAALMGLDYNRLTDAQKAALPLWDFYEYVPKADKITLRRVLLEDKYDLPTEFASAKGRSLAQLYAKELENAPADVLALLPHLRASDLVMLQEIQGKSTKEAFTEFLTSLRAPEGLSVDSIRRAIKKMYLQVDPWYLEDQLQGRAKIYQGLNGYLKEKKVNIAPAMIENLNNYALVGFEQLKKRLPEEEFLKLMRLLEDGINKNPTPQWANLVAQTILAQQDVALTDEEIEFPSTFFNQIMASEISRFLLTDPALRQKLPPDRIRDYLTARAHEAARLRNLYEVQAANENNENKRDTLKDLASRFGQEANDLDNEVDIPHIQLANHYLNHTPYSGRGMVFAHSDNLENMDSDTFRSVVTDPHAMDLTQLKRLQAELGGAKDELPKKSEERKKGSLKFFETLSSNQAVNSTPTIMNCLSKASKEQRDFNVQEVNDCYKELYQKLYALMHFMGADSTTLKHAFVGLLPFDKQVFGGLSDITALLKPGTRLQIVDGKVVRNSLPDFIKNMSNEDLLDLSLLLYQYESGEMPAFLAQKKLEAQAEIDEIERSQDRRRYIHTLALQLGADFLRSPEKYTFPRGVDPKDARSLYAYATFQLSQLNNPNLAAEFKRRKQEMVDETFYRDYPLARMFMSDSQEMKDLRASLKKNSKLYNNGITFADRGWLPSRMLAAEILHRIGEGKLRYETNPGSSIGLMDGPFKQNFDWNRVLNPTLEDPPGKSLDHLLFRVFHQEGLPTGSRFNEPSAWWNWAEEKPAPIFVDGARFLRVYDTSGKTADQVIADLTAQGLENPELTLSLANIDVAAWRASGKRGQGRIALTPSFVPTYLQTTLLTRKLKDVAAKAETDPKVAELKAEREKERKKAEASAAKTAEFNAIVSTEIEQRQKQLASHLPTFPPKALKGAELDNWVARLSQDEKEALLHYANLQSRNKSFPERVPSWASWAVALEQKYPPRLLELKWGLDEAVPITTAKYYSDKIADHKVTLANATDSQLAALFRAHSLGELGGDPSRDTTEDLKKSIRFGHTGPNVRTSIDQVRATLLEEQRKLREKAKDPLAVVELYTDFNYGLPTGYDAYLWAVLQEDGELKEAMYELELRLKKKPFVKGNPKEMFEVPRDKMLELRKKYLQMFADIRDGKPVELAPWAPVLPGNGNREVLSIALTNVIRSIDSALLDTRQKDSTAFMATNLPKLHSGTVREYRTLIAQEVDGSHDPTRSDNVARVKAKARELAPVSAEATTATQTLNPLLVSSLEDFIELTNDGDRSVVTHDSQVLGPKVRKDQAGRTVSAEFKDILNWAKKRYAADILQNPYAERLIDIIMKNPDLRSKFFDRIRTSLPFADLAHFDQVKRMIEGLLGVEGVPPETNFKKVEALRAWLYEKLRAVVGDPDSENPKYPALGTPEYKQANAAALLLAMIDRRNQSGQDPRAAQIRRALGGNLAFTPEGNWPLARKEFEGLKKLDELAAGSDDKADFARRKRDQYHAVLSFLHNQGKGKLGLHSASRIKMLQDSSESNWDVLTHLTKAIPHLGGNNYARERLEDMLQFYDEKKLHALAELFDPNYLNHRRATQIHEQVRRQLIDALAKSPNGQLDEANQEKLDELVALRIAMEIVPQLLTTALASNSPNFQATVEAEKERLIAERKDAIREEVEKDIRRNAARQVLIAKFATEGLNPELLDESKLGSIAQPGSKLWEMSHDPQFLRTVAPLLKDPSLLKARNDAKINFEGIPAHDGQPAREGWVDIVRKNRPAQKQTVDFLEKHFFAPARAMVREEHPGFDRLSEDEQWKLVTAKAEDAFLSRHVFEQLYHEIKLKRHLRDNIKPFADAQQDILDLFVQTRDELRAEHGDNWRELPPATKRAKIAERARQLLAKLPDSPDTERNKARVAHFNALLSYMNENAVSGGKSPSIIYPDPDQFLDRVHAAANIGELGLHSPLDERRKRELERGEQEQEEQIRRINFLTSMADRRLRSLQLEQTIANQNLNGLFGILMGKLKGKIPTDQLSSKSDSDKAFVREFRAYFDASEASLKDEYLSPELTAEQWQKWDRLIAMATGSRSEHFFGAGEDIIEQIHYWSGVKRGIETAVKDAKKKQEEAQLQAEKAFGRQYGSNPKLTLIALRNKTLKEENERLKELNAWAQDLYARAASEYVGYHKLYEDGIPVDNPTGMGQPTPAWANAYALEALLDYRRTLQRGKELAKSLQIPGHSTDAVPRLDGTDPDTELERRAINEWIDSALAEDRLFGFGKIDPKALEREILAIRNAEGGKDLPAYAVYRTALTNLQRRGAASTFAGFWQDAHKESTAKRAKEERIIRQLGAARVQMPDGSWRTLKLDWNGSTWDASKLDVVALTYGLDNPTRVRFEGETVPVNLKTLVEEAGEISHEKIDLLKQIKNATRQAFDGHHNGGHAGKFQFNENTVATLSLDERGVEHFTYEDAAPYREKIKAILGRLRECQRIWGAILGEMRELVNIPAEAFFVGDFRRIAEAGDILLGNEDQRGKKLNECAKSSRAAYHELQSYGSIKYWDEIKPGDDQQADGSLMLYVEPTSAEDIAMNLMISSFAMLAQEALTHHENFEDLDAQFREALVWAAVEIVTLGAGKLLTMGRAGLKLLLYASRTVQWAKNAYRVGKFAIRTAGMVTKMIKAARLAARFNRLGGVINYEYMRAKTRMLTSAGDGPLEWKDAVNAIWWTDDEAETKKWKEYIDNHAKGPTALDPSIDTNGNMIPDYYETGSMPAVAQRYADTEKEFYKSMATFAFMAPIGAGLGYLIPARYAALIDPLSFGLAAAGTEVGFQGAEHGFGNIDYEKVAIRGATSTAYGYRFAGFWKDLVGNTVIDIAGAMVNYHKANRDLEAFGLKPNEPIGQTFMGVPITTITDAVGSNMGMNLFFANQARKRYKVDLIKRRLEKSRPQTLADFQRLQAELKAEVPEMFEALKQMEGKDVAGLIRSLEAKAKPGNDAQKFLDHLKQMSEKGLLPVSLDELKTDDFANSRRSVGEIAESRKSRELADFWHKWNTDRASVSAEEIIRMAQRHTPNNADNPMWRFAQEDNPVLALLGPKEILTKYDPNNAAHKDLLPFLAQHYFVGHKPPPPPNEGLHEAVAAHKQDGNFAALAKRLLQPVYNWRYNQQSKAAERYQQRLEGFSHFLGIRLKGGGQDDIKAIRKEYKTLESAQALAQALKKGQISLQDSVSSFGVAHTDNAMALLGRDDQKAIYRRDSPAHAREIERTEEVGKKLDQYDQDTAILNAPDGDKRFKDAADAQRQKKDARARIDQLLKELMDVQGAADPQIVIRAAAQLPTKHLDLNDPVTQQFVKFMASQNGVPEAYVRHAVADGRYGDTMVHVLENGRIIGAFSRATGFSYDTMMRAYPKALEESTKNMTLIEALHPDHLSSPEFGAAIRHQAALVEVKKVEDAPTPEQRAAKVDDLVRQPYFAQGAGYDLVPVQHLDLGLPSSGGRDAKLVPGPNGTMVPSGSPEHRKFIKNLAQRASVNPDKFLRWLQKKQNSGTIPKDATISDLLTEFANNGTRVTPTIK